MDLEGRVAALERRLAALEDGRTAADGTGSRPPGGDFWALERLKEDLAAAGAEAGGVLFTGAVRLSERERYEWQAATPADALLAGDDPADATTADSLAALGHPVRLRLLRAVLGGARTAAELAALPEVGTTGRIYHHLRLLTAAGWLHTAGRGRYEVPAARVVPLLVMVAAAKR